MDRPFRNVNDDNAVMQGNNSARLEFTVGYDNTGLWCGAAFFGLLSALFFVMISGLALIHAGIVPGRLPPGFGLVNYVFAATVCTVLGLAGWYSGVVAVRRSQSFEVWTWGIRWIRRKQLCCQLPWEDITSLVLRDDNGNVVLHGRAGQSTLRIPTYFSHVDTLIGRLEEETELESLLVAGRPTASHAADADTRTGFQPLVCRRGRLVFVQFLFLLLMSCCSVVAWTNTTAIEKSSTTLAERRIRGGTVVMRYLGPALCVGAVWSLLSTWLEVRIDRDGLWIRYLLGHRRYSWNSLRQVDVQLKRHRQHALRGGHVLCVPELHIQFKSGGELILHQLDDAYRFRDLIQAGPDALLK